MNLFDTDYRILSEGDKEILKQIERDNKTSKRLTIKPASLKQRPQSVQHYLSLFPNNYLSKSYFQRSDNLPLIRKFNELISSPSTTERDVLRFIKQNKAYHIIASAINYYPFGNHGIFLFPEFRLASNYQVDYLLVGKNSQGYHFVFIEMEAIYRNITRQDDTFGEAIRKGIEQISDWRNWLEQSFSHLYHVFEKYLGENQSLPSEFSKFDSTRIHYCIVAGRRSDFKGKSHRKKRQETQMNKINIIHYDNLVEEAGGLCP